MNILDDHRRAIDRIDGDVLGLLEERLRLAREVALHKSAGTARLRDRERERRRRRGR